MTWKEFVYQNVIEYCNNAGTRTFSLQELLISRIDVFRQFSPTNNNVEAKIRQQLQFLRNDNLITFLDNSGHYTLRGIALLEPEAEETKTIDLTKESPEKRDYLVELYVRNVFWARKAREVFGDLCIFNGCKNTFFREDGMRYIEVHHIIPLCEGGEDGLWNLSVLCAHHHRMAHYSDKKTRDMIKNQLQEGVRHRI